jgi:thiopeptide-type bacteriocin biosynthesis protein
MKAGGRAEARTEFFVLRAPLWAFEAFEAWGAALSAAAACAGSDAHLEQALEADRALLRRRLAELLTDDQVADGLALVSTDVVDAVSGEASHPETKRGRSAERSLVRYVTRLGTRPDLFGLAAAYQLGGFDPKVQLGVPPRAQLEVRARVDSGLLRRIVRHAVAQAIDDPGLAVRRNPGLYEVGGRLRVAARRPGTTAHRLVEMRPTPSIRYATETADGGTTLGELVAGLEARDVPPDHARRLVRRLLDSELLVPVDELAASGPEPADQAIELLESVPGAGAAAAATRAASRAATSWVQHGRRALVDVSAALAPAGVEVDPRLCLQVDARRTREVALPERVRTEMLRAVDLLTQVAPREQGALTLFSDAFERRFGSRSVPLLAALDPDYGLRIGSSRDAEAELPAASDHAARTRPLLALLGRGLSAPDGTVVLTDADLAALAGGGVARLPDAFSMLTSIVARDSAALAAGAFQLVEPTLNGPSGARLLGRLCHGDPALDSLVREHLAREEALDPDAIHAELSLAPETLAGLNVTQRPRLHEWEIEYGGASSAPPERRIAPSDLMVSVEHGQVVLRSVSLGRRVVPSSTTAMNLNWVSLPAGRFLISLAHQRVAGYLAWNWGDLSDAPALPRVIHGRTILSLRRWNVPASELADAGTDAAGFRRLQEWRRELGLPRLVSFEHPKSRLLVDLDNVLSVDAFLGSIAGLDPVRLVEAPTDESPVRGVDGRYVHELIVPFTLEREPAATAAPDPVPPPVSERNRRFPPGSEWLYLNLYGPTGAADRVLVDHVGPVSRRLRAAGLADRWFFIRYADPARHLRVRYHGTPGALLGEVLPALHEALEPALADGLLYRISVDTYEREIERYGGIPGVELMEQVSEADSDAVLEILAHKPGPLARRHLAVASVAALYDDAGLSLTSRFECSVTLRTSWAPRGVPVGVAFGERERAERAQVAQTVAALDAAEPEPAICALQARSGPLALALGQLRTLAEEGVLERPFDEVMASLAHMSVNRLLTRGGNADEARVHHALARIYEGGLARERAALSRDGVDT